MLVIHYTGMESAEAALARLCDPESRVSAHYVIGEDGGVTSLVDEKHRAWHAGEAFWCGHTDINGRSVGIELVNPGHEFGYRDFPDAQMVALEGLARDILGRHPIPARNVVGHSDVAPGRKADPGERFDWKRLAAAGVGLWPEGDIGEGDADKVSEMFSSYGYDTRDMEAAVFAFQRHFCPETHGSPADGAMAERLRALLDLCDT
ncbi:MAG: N-acetylmuramoyl-L-alanine amidase [Proteobacteria bacterium]|nr:N-acetylmuramoyl-L-alanine amidase [Pseudomonadota bacterium]